MGRNDVIRQSKATPREKRLTRMLFIPVDVLNPKEVARNSQVVDHEVPYRWFTVREQ